jgi:low affinity Fe/Cu permease
MAARQLSSSSSSRTGPLVVVAVAVVACMAGRLLGRSMAWVVAMGL